MSEQTITLPVTGMTCANCAANIERGLKKLEGVQNTNVNFAAEQAVVAFDPKQLHVKEVVNNIERSGYKVVSEKIELPVTGMTCANCAANIERALNKKVPGVVQAAVNFATERVSVEYIPGVSGIDNILSAIEKAGYGAVLPDDDVGEEDAEQAARRTEIKDQTRKFATGVIFALPLFVLSMMRDFNLIGPWSHAPWVNWFFLVLATPVQFYTGWDYYITDTKALEIKAQIWMFSWPWDHPLPMFTRYRFSFSQPLANMSILKHRRSSLRSLNWAKCSNPVPKAKPAAPFES